MKMIVFSMIAFYFVTPSSFAQSDRGGNGGNAIVCYDSPNSNHLQSVEFFDYWEMNHAQPIRGGIHLGEPELTVKEKLEIALKRVSQIDGERGVRYQSDATEIIDHINSYLMSGISMQPIPDDDTDHAVPEGNCKKVQFAVQLSNPQPGLRRFQINRDLWDNPVTPNDAKAGLILHEVIYREAIRLGQRTSDHVRPYNYAMATALLDRVSAEDTYRQLAREAGLPIVGGLCHVDYAQNISQFIGYREELYRGEVTKRLFCGSPVIRLAEGFMQPHPDSVAGYDPDKKLLSWAQQIDFQIMKGASKIGQQGYWDHPELDFDSTGKVIKMNGGQWLSGAPIAMNVNGKSVNCPNGYFGFIGPLVSRCYFDPGVEVPSNDRSTTWAVESFVEINESQQILHTDFTTPVTMKVRNSSEKFPFWSVDLDSNSEVIYGDVWENETILNGRPATLNSIETRVAPGPHAVYYTKSAAPATIRGKRVIFPDGMSSSDSQKFSRALFDAVKKDCAMDGFKIDGERASFTASGEEIQIREYTLVYNLNQDSVIGKVDEKVNLVKYSPGCIRNVPLRP